VENDKPNHHVQQHSDCGSARKVVRQLLSSHAAVFSSDVATAACIVLSQARSSVHHDSDY